MTRPRGLIFDLDGTLLDSLEEIARAMNSALAGLGLPGHPVEAYAAMVGEGAEVLAARAAPPGAPVALGQLAAAYRAAYTAQGHRFSRPYPGVEGLLDVVSGWGVPLAVLSNKRDDLTKAAVGAHFGRWRFVEVRGEQPGVPRKPDPRAAMELARAFFVAPAEVCVVGDTPIDVETARRAGMRMVGVTWGFRSRAELVAAGCPALVDTPLELAELLGA